MITETKTQVQSRKKPIFSLVIGGLGTWKHARLSYYILVLWAYCISILFIETDVILYWSHVWSERYEEPERHTPRGTAGEPPERHTPPGTAGEHPGAAGTPHNTGNSRNVTHHENSQRTAREQPENSQRTARDETLCLVEQRFTHKQQR